MKYDEEVWSRLKPRQRSGAARPQQQRSSGGATSRSHQKASPAPKRPIARKRDVPIGKKSVASQPDTSRKTPRIMSNIKLTFDRTTDAIASNKRLFIGGAVAVVAIGGITLGIIRMTGNGSHTDTPQSLGVSEGTGRSQVELPELPEATPSFTMLYPSSNTAGDYRVVRVSPEGNTPAYTYLDDVSGTTVRVTQQQVKDIPSYEGIGAVAENFQATDVVQLDELLIYHGINERSGVQSIITEKEQILVLIASPRQLSEEVWVSYIASLE